MIDYAGFPFAKGTPRVLDRIDRKAELAAAERACRKAVKSRDKGRCVVPGCKSAAKHLHHIVYRSHGGKWQTQNIASLCTGCHQLVHGGLLFIAGDADKTLTFKESSK